LANLVLSHLNPPVFRPAGSRHFLQAKIKENRLVTMLEQ
jgi:hypothetical protein